jgi:hypothetical protein
LLTSLVELPESRKFEDRCQVVGCQFFTAGEMSVVQDVSIYMMMTLNVGTDFGQINFKNETNSALETPLSGNGWSFELEKLSMKSALEIPLNKKGSFWANELENSWRNTGESCSKWCRGTLNLVFSTLKDYVYQLQQSQITK